MFKMTDPFSYYKSGTLETQGTNIEVGTFLAKYQVTYDEDVSLASGTAAKGSPANKRVYIVSCTQKVSGYNKTGLDYKQDKPGELASAIARYSDYPVMLENTLTLKTTALDATSKLVDYSPQTVNSQVQTSNNVSNAASDQGETTNSSTIGSSQAQSNSFSTNVGLQGKAFGMGVGHDSSSTTSSDRNSSVGSSSGYSGSEDASSSASMSVKDWGAYASINPTTNAPTWVFGQEYPWDVFAGRTPWLNGSSMIFNPDNTNQVLVALPHYMTDRLMGAYSGGNNPNFMSLPPSQLSMFGYDFVMKAQWVIAIPNGVDDIVTVSHSLSGSTASHGYDTNDASQDSGAHVYVDKSSTTYILTEGDLDVELDLGTMGLEPVGAKNIVGFIPANFVTQPTPVLTVGTAPKPFVIFSNSNTMLIKDTTQYSATCPKGAGFLPDPRSLNAKVVPDNPLTFTLLFKVTDVTSDYSLHFKHWKFSVAGVQVKIVINGDEENALIKTLDAEEGEGAENNLLDLTLRNQNYASVNYCDTLVLGLNSIDVTLTPMGNDTVDYALRAIAIQPG
jgi:hypothetical protein